MKTKAELMELLENSIKTKDNGAFIDAVADIVDTEANAKIGKAVEDTLKQNDMRILEARGARMLTSDETKFYEALIECQKTEGNFRQAVTGGDIVLPQTVIDAVFENIEKTHSLLSHVDLSRVNAKVKMIFSKSSNEEAAWGKMDATISSEASITFEELDVTAKKVSGFIVIPNCYLDLGPQYMDRLVRTYLYEMIANALEKGIINNLNITTGPIGMMANLKGAITTNAYPAKAATAVTDWTPKGLSSVISAMTKDDQGKTRVVTGLFLVINPTDYYKTLMPAICVQNASGDWVVKQPYPIDIVQSAYCPEGKAILGMDKRYFLGAASDPKGVIDSSDEFKFLDDARTYKIKVYADGLPKDNNAFQVLNISGLKEAAIRVNDVSEKAAG